MNLLKYILVFSLFAFSCSKQENLIPANPYNLDLVQTIEDYNNLISQNPDNELKNLNSIPGIVLDIRYATNNNFTGKVIYTTPEAFLRKPVAEALRRVQDSLAHHNLALKIFDAYRPYSATLKFYEVYPDTNFVANPKSGSRHNRGCAVDLTLVEKSSQKEIPMPSFFDDFSEKANPEYSNLSDSVKANRKLLFDIMSHFGFTHYPTEWWHFDYKNWQNYKLMNLSFEQLNTLK